MKSLKNRSNAFTLIELLIVIVIIGILAGVVLAVINPAQQIRRSNQSSARGVVAKACMAYQSCYGATQDVALCDTATEAGYSFPSSTYGGAFTVTSSLPRWSGSNSSGGTCTIACEGSTGRITVSSCDIAQAQ